MATLIGDLKGHVLINRNANVNVKHFVIGQCHGNGALVDVDVGVTCV